MFENSNIKRKILEGATEFHKNGLFESFIHSFYSYIPIDDKKSYDVAEFTKIAVFIFKELCKKRNKPRLIEVVNDNMTSEGEDVVIAVLNDDMPFLVDSITEFLTRNKYKVKHMMNALLCVKRDNEGGIVSIHEIDGDHQANESAIYIKLSLLKQDNYLKKLTEEIDQVLAYVRSTCIDWELMLERLDEANDWLVDSENHDENKEFLRWLGSNNFTFIGYREYQFGNSQVSKGESLGVVKLNSADFHRAISQDVFESNNVISNKDSVIIGKVREISKVHRRTNLDYICVLKRERNKLVKARVFLGLFSTRLDYQSVTQIPVIRSKVDSVVKKARFNENSFNQKELFSIIETLPRDELFQLSEDELFLMAMMILSSLHNPRVLFFARDNRCKFFINLLIFFPKSRVTSDIVEKVQFVINQNIKGKFIQSTLRFSIMGLAYIHISMKVNNNSILNADLHKIEQKLEEITRRWDENLDVFIERKFGIENTNKLLEAYKGAFPTNYQSNFSGEDAVNDIEYINQILKGQEALFSLYQKDSANSKKFNLKTYNLESKVDLHKVMPIIENLGFCTVEENVFKVSTELSSKPVLIQDFLLVVQSNYNLEVIQDNVQEVIKAVFDNKIRNDIINQLALKAGLSWREIFLLDAYCRYMLQIKFTYSQAFIKSTLVKNSSITKLIIELFHIMFDPKICSKEGIVSVQRKIKTGLLRVLNSSEDKVLRKLIELISNTLRTNYFQKSEDGSYKDYVSLKLNSRSIIDLPLPKPYAEIFVYSVEMEGVHLRGGKISRGGLRWSDRVEDYRTEVLGLMKAQMTKNAIIIPDGAKGGFLVKHAERFKTSEELFVAGVGCYKTLLRGMLDITDNIISGKVVKPKDVVCFDDDDGTYLFLFS